MKIVVISTPVFKVPLSGYGGLEAIAWYTAKGLAEKGHNVFLVAPDGSECPGATVIPIGPEKQLDEHMAFAGYPEVKEGEIVHRKGSQGYWQHLMDADVVIDHSWLKFSYLLKMEGSLKAPVLGVMHAPINTMINTLPTGVEKPCFVCISDDQKAHFEALFSPAKAKRAYNGIDLDFYKPMKVPRTERFLFLARFSSVKNPDICQDACITAGVSVDMIGDTSITGEPAYLEKCRARADGKQIKIIGGVSRGETVHWMSQSRGFIHLAKSFREPFGLAPVEAQACGNGVLCWDYGALRETVKQGETGFIVSSLDEAVNILREGKLDHINRNRCREWASQFSLQKMVDCYESLCYEAIDSGGW